MRGVLVLAGVPAASSAVYLVGVLPALWCEWGMVRLNGKANCAKNRIKTLVVAYSPAAATNSVG